MWCRYFHGVEFIKYIRNTSMQTLIWKIPVIFTLILDMDINLFATQSIGHPHPKPIKLRQAGWPLSSMCICCSGVMITPVVSGCHWGSQWVPYATEEHTAIWHFLLSLRGCWYQYPGSLIIRNTWSLKLWNAHNDQSIPVSIIWSYVYQIPTTFNFSRTILNMDSHLLGN